MTPRRIGAIALVLGAAAGAVAGAALITSAPAYATDPPPVPSPFDFVPPGEMGNPTNVEDSSFPYLYNFLQEDNPYTTYDQAGHVVGAYETQETGGIVGLLPLLGFSHDYQVAIDSTGAAPDVGTVWDRTAFASVVAPGGYAQAVIANSYMSSPDGTSSDLFGILPGDAIANYFSTGPTGILDELGFFGTWVPIIDIPA